MNNIAINKVRPNQISQLQKISIETFKETYSAVNSEADMQKYIKDELNLEKLLPQVANKNSQFYFATTNQNIVVAYLKLNFGKAQTELKDENSVEIERIYVLNAYQGRNLGQQLLNTAMETAKSKNAHFIWLGVWEKNLKAINFYHKNGFVVFDKHIFKLGDDEQTDYMMKLQLT